MQAMILAAGLGTRLKHHTANRPKALVEINGKPLLEHIILNLKKFGFHDIVINVHHFAEQIIQFIDQRQFRNVNIAISRENDLLDTGGGLLHAKWFFDPQMPFLLHNVDILSDLDLAAFMRYHIENKNLATIAVRQRKTQRYILFNDNMQLVGWESLLTNERILVQPESASFQRYSFMGIHAFSPDIFQKIERKGAFSIISAYLDLARRNEKIIGFLGDAFKWLDVGKPESLTKAADLLKKSQGPKFDLG